MRWIRSAIFAASLSATVAFAEPALDAHQAGAPVAIDGDATTVEFELVVTASCPESQRLLLTANIADTVSFDTFEVSTIEREIVTLSVPSAELAGLEPATLCRRAVSADAPAQVLLLPDAFSAQVTALCLLDGEEQSRASASTALTVAMPCTGEPAAAESASAGTAAEN